MTDPLLHVQMLGGFSIQVGDEPLAPIPTLPASLLAFLIVHRDRAHTRDLLAGRFWSETTDDAARRNLSQALWQIKSRTKDDVDLTVVTTNTVRFNPSIEVVVDAEIFERRLDEFERRFQTSKYDVRVSDLSAIVDSYRGDLLAGYYDEWLGDQRDKLRARYRAALSQLVQLTSADGDYETALRHALLLVAKEPFDEVGHREVLRLYAVNGQPSAAERHFQRLVRDLDDQLGIEPSAETTQLMRRISEDASSPPVGFADVERDAAEFVGRRAERSAVLNRVIDLTSSGKGGFVLIEGDPGIGKTRLAEELAKGAEWRGAYVLVGRHVETSALTPYEGLKEALEPATVGLRGDRLQNTVDPLWLQQASGVLEGLASFVEGGGQPALRPAEEPWRTTEALARVLLAQGGAKPTVLILEDVHNADEDTMAVLTQLSDRLIDSQVLVCVTYQLAAAQASPAIWEGLSEIEAEPGSSRVVVSPLDPDEINDLIVAELGPGRLSSTVSKELIDSTAGNPYLVLELLRSPLEMLDDAYGDARREPDDGQRSRLDDHILPKLTRLIARRIELAPDHVRAVLETVAAIGAPAAATVVARAADLDEASAIDGLQRAVDLDFLIETERGCDFGHTQTRHAVYDRMAIEQRSDLHGRIVDALTLSGQGVGSEQLARHAWLAGQWHRAYQYHALAAETALKVNAYQTAAEHLGKADQAARSAGLVDGDRVEDLFEIENVFDILGRRDDQAEILTRIEALDLLLPAESVHLWERRAWLLLNTDGAAEAVEIARDAVDDARASGVNCGELLTIVGTALARSLHLSSATEPLTEAIAELRADGRSAVVPQLVLGRTYAELHEVDAAHGYLDDAYNEAKAAGDARTQVEALGHQAAMWALQSEDLRSEAAYLEAISLAQKIGYRQGEGQNLVNLAVFHMIRGRGGRALALLEEADTVYASLNNVRNQAFVKVNTAWVRHWVIGDDVTAEREASEAAVHFRRLGDLRAEAVCLTVIAGAERRSGRRRRARNRLLSALERASKAEDRRTEVQVLLGLALVDLTLDQYSDALAQVARARQVVASSEFDGFTAVLAAVEAVAHLRNGDRDAALALTDTIINSNHSAAELAHLAAWWCAEVLIEAEQLDAASAQVAYAYDLLSATLEGLPPAAVEAAWSDVPEHRSILEARDRFFVDQVTLWVPSVDAPTGRPLTEDDLVSVTLTRSDPDDRSYDTPGELRRHRLLRVAAEATDQGGIARRADLAEVLGVSERTVKRDMALLRKAGLEVASRRSREENP